MRGKNLGFSFVLARFAFIHKFHPDRVPVMAIYTLKTILNVSFEQQANVWD